MLWITRPRGKSLFTFVPRRNPSRPDHGNPARDRNGDGESRFSQPRPTKGFFFLLFARHFRPQSSLPSSRSGTIRTSSQSGAAGLVAGLAGLAIPPPYSR